MLLGSSTEVVEAVLADVDYAFETAMKVSL